MRRFAGVLATGVATGTDTGVDTGPDAGPRTDPGVVLDRPNAPESLLNIPGLA